MILHEHTELSLTLSAEPEARLGPMYFYIIPVVFVKNSQFLVYSCKRSDDFVFDARFCTQYSPRRAIPIGFGGAVVSLIQ